MSAAALSPQAESLLRGLPPARRRIYEVGLLSGVVDPMAAGPLAEAQRERRRALDEAHAAAVREAARKAAIDRAALLARVPPPKPVWRVILDEVCEAHGVLPDDILGPRCKRALVIPRHAVFYRVMAETPLNTTEIARKLRRDHTTVIYGARRHAERNGLPVLEGMREDGPAAGAVAG